MSCPFVPCGPNGGIARGSPRCLVNVCVGDSSRSRIALLNVMMMMMMMMMMIVVVLVVVVTMKTATTTTMTMMMMMVTTTTMMMMLLMMIKNSNDGNDDDGDYDDDDDDDVNNNNDMIYTAQFDSNGIITELYTTIIIYTYMLVNDILPIVSSSVINPGCSSFILIHR